MQDGGLRPSGSQTVPVWSAAGLTGGKLSAMPHTPMGFNTIGGGVGIGIEEIEEIEEIGMEPSCAQRPQPRCRPNAGMGTFTLPQPHLHTTSGRTSVAFLLPITGIAIHDLLSVRGRKQGHTEERF